MKKLSFLALAAVGLLLSACTSDKDVAENALNQYDMIEGQSAWLAVGIALPGDPATRTNEDLNDGLEGEFAVYSAKLVLFKGASEDEATLVKDYDIAPTWNNETGDNVPPENTEGSYGEVTSTANRIVQEIEAPSLGVQDNLYGYVILNWEGNVGPEQLTYTAGTKFSFFKEKILKAIGIADETKGYGLIKSTKGLVMTNVPIADKAGGDDNPKGANITTLAKIDKNAIYNTKAAAEASGAKMACIYVERAAVKVEVKKSPTLKQVALDDGSNIDFTFDGWALGNVNSSATGYYNTRQFETDWLEYMNIMAPDYLHYRMVGRTQFFTSTDHTKAFRTYFGRDVNYTGNTGLINVQIPTDAYTLADGGITYTYENTFDENSQIWANTTYVGFKVTIGSGDFYTIEGQPNTKLGLDDLPGQVAKNASATILAAITGIDDQISADLAKTTATGRVLPTSITNVSYSIVPVVTLGTRNDTDGSVSYTYKLSITDVKDQNGDAITGTDLATITGWASAYTTPTHDGSAKIYKYVGGVTYYSMRIAHFGDAETPWSAPAEAYNQYDKVYPTNGKSLETPSIEYGSNRASAWLGRWGIVRNNWYRLTLDAITGLGSPVPEDYSSSIGNTPDDNPKPKYYIAAHVHILPWAVRKQSVTF